MNDPAMIPVPPVDDRPPGILVLTRGPIPPRRPMLDAAAVSRPIVPSTKDLVVAETALQWLRDNLSIGEQPPGSNHNAITELFGIGDGAWCAMTVSLALNVAWGDINRWQVPGVGADYQRGTAYVPSLRQHLIDAGVYDQLPSVGAVNIYAWSPGTPIGDHTGMTEAWVDADGNARTDALVADQWDRTVIALEGNCNDNLVRIRRSMGVIDGFGHPPYTTTGGGALMALTDQQQDELYGWVRDLHAYDAEQKDHATMDTPIEAVGEVVNQISAKLDSLKVGGGAIDVDALADKVTQRVLDKLGERLKA